MSNATPSAVVPFNDLARGTALLRPEIDSAIAKVLSSGWYIFGPEHDALEHELSTYLGVTDTVLVGNGTDALQLALTAIGVGAGDFVLTVANAGGYTSTAARSIGAVPVYADVEPDSLLLSLRTFEAALESLPVIPRALVITHLFGAVVETAPIIQRARSLGIAVVEDCAQALGASRDGKKAGTFGDIATMSFYPTKNLGALGDGGAVATSTPELATKLRQLRQYGWQSKYHATLLGGRNSRLDEMQAAILRVKLPYLDGWNETRREIHRRYETVVGQGARMINRADRNYIGHLAVMELDDRPRAQDLMARAGVKTDVHYPTPDHQQALVQEGVSLPLPVTERTATRLLTIPLFPELRGDEVDRICNALEAI